MYMFGGFIYGFTSGSSRRAVDDGVSFDASQGDHKGAAGILVVLAHGCFPDCCHYMLVLGGVPEALFLSVIRIIQAPWHSVFS